MSAFSSSNSNSIMDSGNNSNNTTIATTTINNNDSITHISDNINNDSNEGQEVVTNNAQNGNMQSTAENDIIAIEEKAQLLTLYGKQEYGMNTNQNQNILNYTDLNLSGKTSPTSSSSSISSTTATEDTSPITNGINNGRRNTTTGNSSEKKKRIVRPGKIDADFENCAIVVHYTVETFKDSSTMQGEKTTHCKRVRVRKIKEVVNLLPLAEEIVGNCQLIHRSKLHLVKDLLGELQTHSLEKKIGKRKNSSTLQYIDSLKVYRRPNFRFLKSWSPGTYEGDVNERGLPHGHGVLKEGITIDDNGEQKDMLEYNNDKKKSECDNNGAKTINNSNEKVSATNRRVYTGHWENGLPSNYGTITHGDSKKYEGFWVNGKPHGFGVETRSDGDIYRGYWVNGKRQGYGVRYWPDGQRFGGEWVSGKMQGYGIFVWPSQLQYSGQWLEHKRNGYGHELHQQVDNNATYTGEWRKGKRHGLGIRIRSCGSTYKGLFVNGKRRKRDCNPIECNDQQLDSMMKSVAGANYKAQYANYKTEEIVLNESLKMYLMRLNCDKTCTTSDALIDVIVDMITAVKVIPGGELEPQEILKHGKRKREQLGREIWNRKVAQHFGLLLKTLKQRKKLIENNTKNVLQVITGDFDPEMDVPSLSSSVVKDKKSMVV